MTDPNTLYPSPAEIEAGGLGFVARTSGAPGHDVVALALEALRNMAHRGGVAPDGRSGDGAGILTQIPHRLLSTEITDLPQPGDYAVGMLFLPRKNSAAAQKLVHDTLSQVWTKTSAQTGTGLKSGNGRPDTGAVGDDLMWREVPVNPNLLGSLARRTCPEIRQMIIRRPNSVAPGEAFERFLLTTRKALVAAGRRQGMDEFSVPSLSARTVVYKGLMLAPLLADFYPDLCNPLFESALAVVHTRNSPNSTASWHRAQPLRLLAHTGQITTVRGNQNWLKARESTLHSPYWAGGLDELQPLLDPSGSDSSQLDNMLELLVRGGRDIHHGLAMLVPDAWESLVDIHPHRHAFYRYHAALLEPWEGPAAVIFTDGRRVGAALDRNGLRSLRYLTTRTNLVVATSEAGAVNLDEGIIATRGKLGPGQMILVDMARQLFLTDDPVKNELARRPQYQEWVNHFKTFSTETRPADFRWRSQFYYQTPPKVNSTPQWLARFQAAFGYTREEIEKILQPMAAQGKEPTGSMGDDTPPAALSAKPRPLFHYFKQRFAQVAGPPIDPLRETFVMSLTTRLGARANLLAESARHAYMIELPSPVLTDLDLENLKGLGDPRFQTTTIAARYPAAGQVGGLSRALNRLCAVAERAIDGGKTILILSDHGVDKHHAPVPALLAVAAVHHHLVRRGKRAQASLVVESGEVREVHHLACLLGFGANAVNPYLALATVESLAASGKIKPDLTTARRNFIRAMEAGLLKIMSKIGISTVESYTGAQLFETIGLRGPLVDEYFPGTPLWPGSVGLAHIAAEITRRHRAAFAGPKNPALDDPGFYQFTPHGERHAFAPAGVAALHAAVRLPGVLSPQASLPAAWPPGQARSFIGPNFEAGFAAYRKFTELLKQHGTVNPRNLLEFQPDRAPVDLAQVEPLEAIFGRMSTAGMSHGALSREAHETLAIAMNRLGARSNSGEGGSAQGRFGTERNDRIKQVASGRFGVTPVYLMSADELQIKMAQGAKPGEGGLLPGHKVSAEIAAIRHTRAGTALISPPAHADVHSTDDLAQLIFDLKQVNPAAAVSVKLVSQTGVGALAVAAAKCGADVVYLAGHAGGTGAAAWSSIKHAGLPWEFGLTEIRQALQRHGLRSQVRVRVDGGLQTGRDVVLAALLGADEFSFGTAALVAQGCLMTRACHINTCPTGVATQQPHLRANFAGQPEHMMAYFHFVAQDVRRILAHLGFGSLSEIIGCTDLLRTGAAGRPGTDWLDLSLLLENVDHNGHGAGPSDAATRTATSHVNSLLLAQAGPALESGQPVQLNLPVSITDRAVGAALAGAVAATRGKAGLPDGTFNVTFHGSAGQSFGAFCTPGTTLTLIGEANDYVAKGMAGGQIVVRPPLKSGRVAADSVILGSAALYGATGGSLFAAGQAGDRFAVRNSGTAAVVEGVGDHACEYMTGGVVVVLGRTGYNFGAGMSGGVAFVLDEAGILPQRANRDTVQLVRVTTRSDTNLLRMLIMRHIRLTGSDHGQSILNNWASRLGLFWKATPRAFAGVQSSARLDLPTLELSRYIAG